MTDAPVSTPPPGAPEIRPPVSPLPPPAPRRTTPAGRTKRTRTARHITAIVIGCVLALPGLGLLVGGGAAAIAQAVATDDDGYFRFTIDGVESGGVAVAATDVWLDTDRVGDVDGPPWVFDVLDVDVRLRVDGVDATDDVFVGVARSSDVSAYLAGAEYSDIVELRDGSPEYEQREGVRRIEPPTDQDFWTVAATGEGEQEVDWVARGGRWSIVVMNADGTPGVAADVEIGVRSDAVTPIAVALIAIGGMTVVVAGVLIALGARGRRPPIS